MSEFYNNKLQNICCFAQYERMPFNSKIGEDSWSRTARGSIPKFNYKNQENLDDTNKSKSLAGSWAV